MINSVGKNLLLTTIPNFTLNNVATYLVTCHSFAATHNGGLSMSVESRLLGHGFADVNEKVYAKLLPAILAAEIGKIGARMQSLDIIE